MKINLKAFLALSLGIACSRVEYQTEDEGGTPLLAESLEQLDEVTHSRTTPNAGDSIPNPLPSVANKETSSETESAASSTQPVSASPTVTITASSSDNLLAVGQMTEIIISVPYGADRVEIHGEGIDPIVLENVSVGEHVVTVTPTQQGRLILSGTAEKDGLLSEPASIELNVALPNCDDGNFECEVERVQAMCAHLQRQTHLGVLRLPRTFGCPFDERDNLSPLDATIRARRSSQAVIGIPAGSVLCHFKNLESSFQVRFDDQYILTLSDAILVNTIGDAMSSFHKESDLAIYDWLSLRGDDGFPLASFDPEDYCLSHPEGSSSCLLPNHDTFGKVQLNFDEAISYQLSAWHEWQRRQSSEESRGYYFEATLMGDNDPGDCELTDDNPAFAPTDREGEGIYVEFNVEVEYVLPQ